MPAPSAAAHEEGFIRAKDDLRLFWQRFTPQGARATVAVLHGAGDHSGRYPALVSALVSSGLSVALVDLRGHGQSDGTRWHVDRFSEYLEDVDAFLAKLQADRPGEKLFLLGHSNGGLIAVLWALTRGAPGRPNGVILSSPYFALAMAPPAWKRLGARILGPLMPRLHVSAGIEAAQLTSDQEMQRWTRCDPLYLRATTPRWFAETAKAQEEVHRRAGEFTTPFLLLVGGADPVADIRASGAFHELAQSADKEYQLYEGFRHELFNEAGRDRPIGTAVSWITARAGARPESR